MPKPAYFLDLLVVLVFAAAGRASHDLSGDVLGVLQTAWPFLTGLVLGWFAVLRQRRLIGTDGEPRAGLWWLDGLVVWAFTLVLGLVIRLATGEGAALPFVLVAAGFLLVGLVGWRGAAHLLTRRARTV